MIAVTHRLGPAATAPRLERPAADTRSIKIEDLDPRVVALLDQAVDALALEGIAATPANIGLWLAGRAVTLAAALDGALLANGRLHTQCGGSK